MTKETLNNTEIFLNIEETLDKIDKERKFFMNRPELKPIHEDIDVVYHEYFNRLREMKTVRERMLKKLEESETEDDNRTLIRELGENDRYVPDVIFNKNSSDSAVFNANKILWTSKQRVTRGYQKGFEDRIIKESFSKQDDFDKIMRISVRTKDVKDKIADKEKKLGRPLTLTEKHFIRDDIRLTKLFNFAQKEDKSITLENCKTYMENKETLQTLGDEVMVVLRPYDKDSKKPTSTNKDRVEYKMNENLNNPNVSYGFFHEFKIDKEGNVLLVIRDKQRILIGETADASVTNYAWSQFPVSRIKRFFSSRSNNTWQEVTKDGKVYEIKDIWKEVDVSNPRND